jgi:hypothetical protein
MRPALDPAGHRVPRTKPTCLLHTWRLHRRRPFVLVLHLHQHQSSRNLHLQYLAKNQSTQHCQSLITQRNDHPPVLEPDMVLSLPTKPSEDGFLVWASKPSPKPQHDGDGIRACREASKRRTRGGMAWLASGGCRVRQRCGRPMARPTNIT